MKIMIRASLSCLMMLSVSLNCFAITAASTTEEIITFIEQNIDKIEKLHEKSFSAATNNTPTSVANSVNLLSANGLADQSELQNKIREDMESLTSAQSSTSAYASMINHAYNTEANVHDAYILSSLIRITEAESDSESLDYLNQLGVKMNSAQQNLLNAIDQAKSHNAALVIAGLITQQQKTTSDNQMDVSSEELARIKSDLDLAAKILADKLGIKINIAADASNTPDSYDSLATLKENLGLAGYNPLAVIENRYKALDALHKENLQRTQNSMPNIMSSAVSFMAKNGLISRSHLSSLLASDSVWIRQFNISSVNYINYANASYYASAGLFTIQASINVAKSLNVAPDQYPPHVLENLTVQVNDVRIHFENANRYLNEFKKQSAHRISVTADSLVTSEGKLNAIYAPTEQELAVEELRRMMEEELLPNLEALMQQALVTLQSNIDSINQMMRHISNLSGDQAYEQAKSMLEGSMVQPIGATTFYYEPFKDYVSVVAVYSLFN